MCIRDRRNRPVLDRAIVISAGVIANLVFAYFLLVGQATTIGFQDINFKPGVLVPQLLSEAESAAAKAGIKAGDIIVKIDNLELGDSGKALENSRTAIQDSPDQPLKLTIKRDTEILIMDVKPDVGEDGKGRIGVMLAPNGDLVRHRAKNIVEAFTGGAIEFQRIIQLTVQGFWQLISNFSENAQQVAGPVKIIEVGAQLAENDLGNLFQFGALISINLAIINILPLPALDGGQLAFLTVEGVTGKPLPSGLQDGIMQTGLVLLLSLGVFIIVRDTVNLAFFQNLF